MRRRAFITLLGGAAAAWPLAARAQQGERVRRIGMLMAATENDMEWQNLVKVFIQRLQELGWTQDRNLKIDFRWAETGSDRLEALAKELVELKPELIISQATITTIVLLQQTRTVPIIFLLVADPVGNNFVKSFSHPDTNATGFFTFDPSMSGKWLELLKEITPGIARAAIMFNPNTWIGTLRDYSLAFRSSAMAFNVEPIEAFAHNVNEIEGVFAALAREPVGGIVLMPDTFNFQYRELIIALAARYRVPAVYPNRQFAAAGGLISYGLDITDIFRRGASYVDRVFKGENVGALPVQAPTKFELVINLKTAKTLGLAMPLHLQQIADEVIE